ncbi:MAG: protein kinase [Myxococcota bacterium]|nr:protein kinase [Myxococcota bacterium]
MSLIAGKYTLVKEIPNQRNLYLAGLNRFQDFRRDVLIRLIHSPQEWEFAARAAKMQARLLHTNITQILDIGQHNNIWYIAYEFTEGITLQELLQNKTTLSVQQVVYLTTEILKSLDYANRHSSPSTYHNNLTMESVLLTPQGTIKVHGFQPTLSLPQNSIFQNPSYRPGNPQDLYSCGKILGELCSLVRDLPPKLLQISKQACAREEQQFRSPKAMYDALLHHFPCSATVSVELSAQLAQYSIDDWDEQPTYISRTLLSDDTHTLLLEDALPPSSSPIQEKPPTPTEQTIPIFRWVLFVALLLGFLFLGFFLGQRSFMAQKNRLRVFHPPAYQIQLNGVDIQSSPQLRFVPQQNYTLEVLSDKKIIEQREIQLQNDQTLIFIIPVSKESPSLPNPASP